MTEVKLYQVGGSVRDRFLKMKTKDIDFAVEAESFDTMREFLVERDFEIFVETPQYFTIRARFPKDNAFTFPGIDTAGMTVDFALCRTESGYTDNRHPDVVGVGDILTDLSRRDFTVNAIAIAEDGSVLDPHNGLDDLDHRRLACVGDPLDRFTEDPLRILRALRFSVTKGLYLDTRMADVLREPAVVKLLETVSEDRVRDELHKMFKHDSLHTICCMSDFMLICNTIFSKFNLWLEPTTAKR